MNERTEILGKSYKPELSIVVYRCDNSHRVLFDEQYYLEAHQINEQGQVLSGKPLMQDTIQEMVDVLYSEQKDKSQLGGIVPDNLLHYKALPGGKYSLVWYRPAETRFFHFAKALKIPSGKMSVPPLLYIVDGQDLHLFAFKKDGRPDEKTKLYRAPFHNINDSGEVCLGNASVKKPADKGFSPAIKYWEDLFWLSEFSHLNGASNPTKSELKIVYNRLLKSKGKKKWADLDELKESKRQIKSILQ